MVYNEVADAAAWTPSAGVPPSALSLATAALAVYRRQRRQQLQEYASQDTPADKGWLRKRLQGWDKNYKYKSGDRVLCAVPLPPGNARI